MILCITIVTYKPRMHGYIILFYVNPWLKSGIKELKKKNLISFMGNGVK